MIKKTIFALISMCCLAYSLDSCKIELTIERTFHKPVIFRYSNDTLVSMVYSGKAGYEWGKIETITKIELDSQSIKRIGNLISKIDQKTFKSLNEIYDDGSSWSFAKIIRFDTVKVDISNPTIDTSRRHLFEVVELVKLFANLAKLRELKENLY